MKPRNPCTYLHPDQTTNRLVDIAHESLVAGGVRGIILDLDNTVVGYGRNDIPGDITAWVARAREEGFRVVLLSNNFTQRVRRVSDAFAIPAIAGALKPLPFGFRRALRLLGTTRKQTIVVGDQIFTDVLGAHLAGLCVILTHPIEPHDWFGTRVLRWLERLFLGRR
jgi:HAD superfamily phosphatase (TIGR01668 family)